MMDKHAGDVDFDFLQKVDCGSELACSPSSASKRASQRQYSGRGSTHDHRDVLTGQEVAIFLDPVA